MHFVEKTSIFLPKALRRVENSRIFAARLKARQPSTDTPNYQLTIERKGMYGFDSKTNCHVSMPSLAVMLVNLDCKKVIGENNYALAA